MKKGVLIENMYMCYLVLVDENIITALNNTKLWKRGPDMGFFNRIKRFFSLLHCFLFI